MKKIWLYLGISAVAALFIFVAVKNFAGSKTAAGAPKNAPAVEVEAAKKDTIVSKVNASGTVEAKDKKSIYIDPTKKIKDVIVKVGDQVKKDALLAQYEDESKKELERQLTKEKVNLEIALLNLQSAQIPASQQEILQARSSVSAAEESLEAANSSLAQTENSILQAKRNIQKAQKDLKDNQTLYDKGAVSLKELEQCKEEVKALEEKLQSLLIQKKSQETSIQSAKEKKQLSEESLKVTLNKTNDAKQKNDLQTQQKAVELARLQVKEIEEKLQAEKEGVKSPITGTIVAINIDQNAEGAKEMNNSAGSPDIEVADLSQFIVKANVSQYDAPNIKIGQPVSITGDSLGDVSYKGVVKRIAPSAITVVKNGNEEKTVPIEITITEQHTVLKPGYTVDVEITTKEKKDTIVIPIISLLKESDGKQIVYVVKKDFKVEKRAVKTGVFSDLYVEVFGIKEGEKVLSNPDPKIKEGMFVQPLENKNMEKNHD